ncbi:hypothetical protein KCU85_g5277, partial [Aureobasidium melanogenum]
MAPPSSADKPSITRSSHQNFVDLKVYVPCVEINGRSYISHNGEIFGPAQQAIGRQSRVDQDKKQLYQEDFSESFKFRGMNDSNDVLQEEIMLHQSPAATLQDGSNDTKNFDGSSQHTVKSAACSTPFSKPITPNKRSVDSCSVPQQEQKTSNKSSQHVPSKSSSAGLDNDG